MPEKKDRLIERIVVLVTPEFKDDYTEMCEAIAEDRSEHIRTNWEAELALYKANKTNDDEK